MNIKVRIQLCLPGSWSTENQLLQVLLQSSTNIDRIVTMYRAAKRSDRLFLEELYMAEITSAIGRSIPNPSFSDVYTVIIKPRRYKALAKYQNRIGKEQIASSKHVMCVRSSMLRDLKSLSKIKPFEKGLLVYSMWEGYKEKKEMQVFLSEYRLLRLRVISLHNTGHADSETIRKVIKKTNPDKIYPVHTENSAWFDQYNRCSELLRCTSSEE